VVRCRQPEGGNCWHRPERQAAALGVGLAASGGGKSCALRIAIQTRRCGRRGPGPFLKGRSEYRGLAGRYVFDLLTRHRHPSAIMIVRHRRSVLPPFPMEASGLPRPWLRQAIGGRAPIETQYRRSARASFFFFMRGDPRSAPPSAGFLALPPFQAYSVSGTGDGRASRVGALKARWVPRLALAAASELRRSQVASFMARRTKTGSRPGAA